MRWRGAEEGRCILWPVDAPLLAATLVAATKFVARPLTPCERCSGYAEDGRVRTRLPLTEIKFEEEDE